MTYTTQMDAARKGIVTPQMKIVAEKEKMPMEKLMKLVAEGKVAIPANKLHASLSPEAVGQDCRTKINVNLGVSPEHNDHELELQKVQNAINMKAEAIMDLSNFGKTREFRRKLVDMSTAMIGTVPMYDAVGMLYRMDGGGEYSVFGNSLLPEERERFQEDLKELFRQAAAQSEEETAAPAEKALPATSRVKLGGVEYLRFLDSVDAGNLWAASYVNVDSLRVASEPFLIWQIIFTVFLILEILLFLYLIHRMIAKPMARFANEVSQLEEKGMLSSQERPGGDMDFLYRSFVDVSNRLKTALEKEYRSKLMIYQSEIKFIQAQVRPHFLYNSFYHLYRMAKMEDNEGVAEMSLRLSSYYRYITRSNENVVPLQMEYHNAADYVEIQKIRFGDRIEVEMEALPAEFQNLPVPRFVLQPLFENAYNHGVEKITGGRIVMRFLVQDDTLTILVENNGACLQSDLDALTAYLEREDTGEQMTALKNVKGRMKLIGGDLTVSRGSLGGFCAALILKRNEGEEGKQNADHSDS